MEEKCAAFPFMRLPMFYFKSGKCSFPNIYYFILNHIPEPLASLKHLNNFKYYFFVPTAKLMYNLISEFKTLISFRGMLHVFYF